MMRTIHKFEINIGGVTELQLPEGSRWLSVASQHEKVALWVELDPNAPKVTHQFFSVGTGDHFPEGHIGEFIGTVMFDNGRYVFHVFEHKP